MDAYAAAYLSDGSPLAADAITLSPYLGFDSLQGAIELARGQRRGIYVLALTSNPEAPALQQAVTPSGVSVGQSMVDATARCNAGEQPGHVGIVVGATIGRTGVDFSSVNGSILAPGIGAQGAGPADLVEVFGPAVTHVLPSTSREVMSAGPDPDALRAAARRAMVEIEAVVGVG
jgi:orotidine-5'-phosphate decarboxylase